MVATHPSTFHKPNAISLVTSLSAILSAPCAGYLALNSAALAVGGGAFGMGAIALWLDQAFIRIPLLAVATLGALAIGAISIQQGITSGTDETVSVSQPTRDERRRNRIGLMVSVVTLLIVVAEIFAHSIMH